MTAERTCPTCGCPLAPEALAGLCARCVARGLAKRLAPEEGTVASGAVSDPAATAVPVSEEPGMVIGRYKLLQRLGEGGFGVVFMAEQREPVVRRVALKILKQGMDTREVIARFEAERQALALMDHPAIAKVFDAGATAPGRPYFVMELVRGLPITRFCDEHGLGVRQRLELFAEVCAAVQHAHQKGIIHRDLKPSNILVGLEGDRPVPKVIDFGIAKATQQLLTDKTLFTRFDQFIGTPQYVSPEQVGLNAMDVDTRSDIYSLGVVLYELLTGHPPLEAREIAAPGFDEMRRIIRELEPPKPSTRLGTLGAERLTTVAKHRGVEPGRLGILLRGDLDWIVLKAIEKDRARRYETANALAQDIRRHLNDEPVSAMPPGAAYKFRKFARRHKSRLAAAAAIAAVLVAATVVSTWQAVRAGRTLEELRATAPAFVEQARTLVAKERFDDAITKLDYAIKLRPDAPEYLVAKGDLLQCQFKLAEAVAVYREALRIQPGHSRAEASVKLCEEVLAAPATGDGRLTRESLAKLHVAMQEQQRPATEIVVVSRLLGEAGKLNRAVWLERLRDLPLGPGMPLEERLTTTPSGRLALDLSHSTVSDLTLLKGMPLESLDLSGSTAVTDLEPLRDLPLRSLRLTGLPDLDDTDARVFVSLRELKELNASFTRISDLGLLRGLSLELLDVSFTRVLSLAPLKGMPLRQVTLDSQPAGDFDALAGAPIEKLLLGSPLVGDLAFLSAMPLKTLLLGNCLNSRNLAVLANLQTLETLILPVNSAELPEEERAAIDRLESLPRLLQITDQNVERGEIASSIGSREEFWPRWKGHRLLRSRLVAAGLEFTIDTHRHSRGRELLLTIRSPAFSDLSLLDGAPISYLDIGGTSVSDLSGLKGLPLASLVISRTPVSDLTPLRGMALGVLNLENTRVESLEPLRGMKLRLLRTSNTPISSLAPLAGMPLWDLRITGTKVTDISPVLDCPLSCLQLNDSARDVGSLAQIETLTDLAVPPGAPYLEELRPLKSLQRISYGNLVDSASPVGLSRAAMTAEEFWQVDSPAEAALVSLAKTATRDPSDTARALKVAALQVWFGRDSEHESFVQRSLAWVESSNNSADLERIAKLASLRPISGIPIREATLRIARKAMEIGIQNQSTTGFPWHSMTVGMAEYRNGNYARAIQALSAAEEAARGLDREVYRTQIQGTAAFFRAMSLFQQGDGSAARALFAATEAQMMPFPTDINNLPVSAGHDDLVLWLACKEAKALLAKPKPPEN